MPRKTWSLLHPRASKSLSKFEKQVLEIVGSNGPSHPKVLEKQLGKQRVVNNWGGHSQASTQALESLHHRGLLRVANRVRGYYAMPLLYGEEIIGWANVSVVKAKLDVQLGFVDKEPKDRAFKTELEAEIERMKVFLALTLKPR